MKVRVTGATAEAFAKKAMYLAWKASGVFGMGFLQDNPSADEERVWKNVMGAGDYPGGASIAGFRNSGEAYADYVFGRMMKVGFKMDGDMVECRGGDSMNPWRGDYQSFCRVYPTSKSLFEAAAKELGCTFEVVS